MKKILNLFLFVTLFISLSGCGISKGDSVEECQQMDKCIYEIESVKADDSEIALALTELIMYNSDDIYFRFIITPTYQSLEVKYLCDDPLSSEKLDELIPVVPQIWELVREYYDIYVRAYLVFEEDIYVASYIDPESEEYISTIYFYFEQSEDDTEEEIIEYLEEHINPTKLFIDYGKFDEINWYGEFHGKSSIIIENTEYGLRVHCFGKSQSDNIKSKIGELLQEYDINIVDDYWIVNF